MRDGRRSGNGAHDDLELGSVVAIATDASSSAPQSAVAISPALDGGAQQPSGSLFREITWPSPVSEITLEMSVLVAAYPPEPSGLAILASLFVVDPANDNLSTRIGLHHQGGSVIAELEEAAYAGSSGPGDFGATPLPSAPAPGKWVRLVRHLTLTSPPKETLTIDGTLVATLALNPLFAPTNHVELHLGFYYSAGPTSPFRVYFDDIVLDGR